MAVDLKTLTPDTSLPTDGLLFGADSQSAASPSVYSTQTVATTLLGSTALTGGPAVTADSPLLDLSQTWNAAGVTFTGLRFNATDTASAAGSLLMDLRVGTATMFRVDKIGRGQLATDLWLKTDGGNRGLFFGSTGDTIITRAAAASIQFGFDTAAPAPQVLQVASVVAGTTNTAGANFTIAGSKGTGTGAGGSIIFQVAPAGSSGSSQNAYATALTIDSARTVTAALAINANTFQNSGGQGICATAAQLGLFNTGLFGWTNNAGSAGALDTILTRDAANTLALRNGANPQAFNIYNTYTDAANYERGFFQWNTNVLEIGMGNAGSGASKHMRLKAGASSGLYFNLGGSDAWLFNSSGHFLANADNTYDIGASGASRPRHGYFGGNLVAGGSLGLQIGTGSAPIYWAGRSQIYSPANGNIQFVNSSGNDFNRLQFGGTTSSFPALKRSSAALQVRLADDSGFATIDGQIQMEGTAPASATATGTAGDLRYDSGYIYVCTATDTWKRVAIATWP